MDARLLLPMVPAPFRAIATALLDRLDRIERRQEALERALQQRNPSMENAR